MIYIGADHNGFKIKEKIKKYFEKNSISYADLGAHEHDKEDDYVDFAANVAKKTAKDSGSRGILICYSGNGMAISANKIKGARAAVVCDKKGAKLAVDDNHANIITMGSNRAMFGVVGIVKAFLSAKPSTASRHARRVKKINDLES